MENKINILHITPFFFPNIGGVETHLSDLMDASNTKRNLNVSVLTYQALVGEKKGKRKEKDRNITVNRIPWFSGLYYKSQQNLFLHFLYLTPRLFFASVYHLAKNEKVDIIHAHGINAAFIGSFLKRLFAKAYVVSFHVDFNFKKDSLTTKVFLWSLENADKVLVLTEKSKKKLSDLGIKSEKIVVYTYWVDQEIFKPVEKSFCRKKLGMEPDKFSIFFVGRMAKEKGVLELLKVAKLLKEVSFYLIGTGDLSEKVGEMSKKLANVNFLGRVDNKRLPLYYSAADLVIIPSQIPSPRPLFEEGVPRVIIEAISCGTPVMGTDSGGMKEVIEKGKVGVIAKGDSKSIRREIVALKNQSKQLEKMKNNCRNYALSRFSNKSAEVIIGVYNDLKIDLRAEKLLKNTGDMALKRRAKLILDELNPQKDNRILDVGCGDGFYLHLLSNLGIKLKLIGTDFDERALESARRNLSGRSIKLVWGDLMKKLPFKDDFFDKIIMSEVTEHLPDDFKGLKEIRRVLKPGGTVCITVPHANYPLFWDPVNWFLEYLFDTHVKSGFFAGLWNQHERLYDKEQIKKVVERAGFKVKNVKSLTFWCLPFNHNILHFMARRLYGDTLSASTTEAVSKFELSKKKPFFIEMAFIIVNLVDRLNDIYQPVDHGVGVFVSAKK